MSAQPGGESWREPRPLKSGRNELLAQFGLDDESGFGIKQARIDESTGRRRLLLLLDDGVALAVSAGEVVVSKQTESVRRNVPAILSRLEDRFGLDDRKVAVRVEHSARREDVRPAFAFFRMDESAQSEVAARWRSKGFYDLEEHASGVHLWLSPSGEGGSPSYLIDRGDRMTLRGPLDERGLSMLVEKAKEEWGGKCRVLDGFKSAREREALWLECQRKGVELEGYEPSPELVERLAMDRKNESVFAMEHALSAPDARAEKAERTAPEAFATPVADNDQADFVDSLPPDY